MHCRTAQTESSAIMHQLPSHLTPVYCTTCGCAGFVFFKRVIPVSPWLPSRFRARVNLNDCVVGPGPTRYRETNNQFGLQFSKQHPHHSLCYSSKKCKFTLCCVV